MNAWTPNPPKIPVHLWLAVPGHEHAPGVEHVALCDGVLMVRDDLKGGAWMPLHDVWPEGEGYLWFGPLMPSDWPA